MNRREQIIDYANSFKGNGVENEELKETIRMAVIDGALWADAHQDHWHDAQGDDLPPINKEVIVLLDNGKVCFAHRPVESYITISIINHSEREEYYPKHYDKGGWNISNVKWWLDVAIPTEEGGEK